MNGVEHDRVVADAYAYGTQAVLDAMAGKPSKVPDPTQEELQQDRERRIIPWKDTLEKVMRYESQLQRQLLQTHHELEAVQARRRGEPAHLARLDINAPPS